jgi:putative inorganic carbon (HCO3(-)) transporter
MFDWMLLYLPASLIQHSLLVAAIGAAFVLLFVAKKTEWILYGLLVWLPLESLLLIYAPLEAYAYVKYIPELVLYGLVVGACLKFFFKRGFFVPPRHPLIRWIGAIVACAVISLLLRWYDPVTWGLGLRQLLRFVLLVIVILVMRYDESVLKKIWWVACSMIALQAVFGMVQYVSGGALDRYLFSTETVAVGNQALIVGAEQTWEPGTRIFATMGRYDRLGSLLALGIIVLFPWIYHTKSRTRVWWVGVLILFLSAVLILTRSRASWIAALVGVVSIGWYVKRDKRVITYGSVALGLVLLYVGVVAVVRQQSLQVVETRSQTVVDRLAEAVSPVAWQNSYDGLGRIYFIINTPRRVVSEYPLFGVGPGRYGGGVAAALGNTEMYDQTHMPFGIENKVGQIDNNWMSIWGEFGTVGLLAWIGLFLGVIGMSREVASRARNTFEQAIAEGVGGLALGIMCIGFFGPYFEFRTLMFYFWLMVGIVSVIWYRIRESMSFLSH